MNMVKFKSIQFNVPGLMAGLLIAMPALAVDLKLNSDHSSQSNDLLLTDPLLPNGGSVATCRL